jgi:hypothetical protein
MKKARGLAALVSLVFAVLVCAGAWAQGNSAGKGGGGGGPPSVGGSPFPSPTPTPTPTITPSTPIGAPSGGGATFGTPGAVALDPLSTPSTPATPAAGSPPPPDRYRELHGHAHARLCKSKGCEQYCDGRERAIGADKRELFVKQCRSYCMEKC